MEKKQAVTLKRKIILISVAMLFAACSSSTPSDSDEFEEEWLLSVRQATEKYLDIDAPAQTIQRGLTGS